MYGLKLMYLVWLGSGYTLILTVPKIAQIQPNLQLTFIQSVRQSWLSAYLVSSEPDQRILALGRSCATCEDQTNEI